ncbi:Aminoacyl-tRNA synthetase class Ia anticodon-binding [Arabidopsis thaliana x Arabidopsis arenosa]|uniref:Aminoacyl-tRNA synthetase class Ia anticodon-binding n=1 Tax=Arabidopsis thaliana x Arabidopsis arenosa TaxID=1240361 RepID=A0A8T2GP98_9BRAS|nr:Aminoacyl-tRNA synthetase class Ia anticodon-binding [Arabidopsis thaliana x Arabidopsis arenosa]
MASESNSFAKRDRLLEIEVAVRKWWEDEDVFRAESRDHLPKPGEKFFSTFPFPYMNGYLHIGHAFSLSKVDFASAYHRLRGANVLLPFGFHCTGMPIKASADKLSREILQFGDPPVFPAQDNLAPQVHEEGSDTPALTGQFKGKKSKVAAKSGGQVYQWQIMRSFGLTDSEIARFRDPDEWLYYFPPLAVEDLKAYGLGCDWRRSFVTTDVNPFFDAFVRWQMRKLKALGKIVKDCRYTIFSPLDRQPCADHDRATGEGVQPQEYTLIKMEVVKPFPLKLSPLEGKRVFLAAATLRPETMYGQTNAWVLPDGKYGAYEISETDVFILTERSALNRAYQNFSKNPKKPSCLVELTGYDLIGLPLKSPLSVNEIIYALPMSTILTNKGTRIPWDNERFLVESLSDSSLYMAYYTVAHIFHDGDMYKGSKSLIRPQQMNDEVWEYLFCDGPYPKSTDIPSAVLSKMKQEFDYCSNGWKKNLAAESSLRTGPPSTYADKVFENDINIAIRLTEKAYKECLFREALKNGVYDLQAARDEYRNSCGSDENMNHDLILNFMDVQTRLIEPICPQFAEYVWRKLLKKEGSVVTAGWPTSNEPDLVLKSANKYLQDSIVLLRKLLGSKKAAKKEIIAELKEILQKDGQAENIYMPFVKFKKKEAISIGIQALNLRLPFGEIEVLKSNMDLIKRQLGLEEVEVYSASDPDDVSKAGPHASLLKKNPPSPGNPTAIFVTSTSVPPPI